VHPSRTIFLTQQTSTRWGRGEKGVQGFFFFFFAEGSQDTANEWAQGTFTSWEENGKIPGAAGHGPGDGEYAGVLDTGQYQTIRRRRLVWPVTKWVPVCRQVRRHKVGRKRGGARARGGWNEKKKMIWEGPTKLEDAPHIAKEEAHDDTEPAHRAGC